MTVERSVESSKQSLVSTFDQVSCWLKFCRLCCKSRINLVLNRILPACKQLTLGARGGGVKVSNLFICLTLLIADVYCRDKLDVSSYVFYLSLVSFDSVIWVNFSNGLISTFSSPKYFLSSRMTWSSKYSFSSIYISYTFLLFCKI